MIAPLVLGALVAAPLSHAQAASVNAAYVRALERRDAAAAAAPYAPDAVFITANNRVVRGKPAIAAMLWTRLTTVTFLGGSCTSDTLQSTAEQAWETGHCTFTTRTASGTHTHGGRYMAYWKRQLDGTWRIEVNIAE